MKKLIIALLTLGLMSCANISSTLKSTAKVEVYSISDISIGTCSSFAIDSNTILTASHCVKEVMAKDGKIMINGKYAKLVKVDDTRGVARLFVQDHGISPLKIADNVNIGDEIWAVGFPLGLDIMINHGWIGGRYKKFILVSIMATVGLSGSPIINERNEVVSILVGGVNHIGFGVDLGAIKDIMK